VIPHLRAFGRSLSGSRDLADDLVQETLLKAWAARKRFQAGTNMRAWTFIILRNLFLSQMRRRASRANGTSSPPPSCWRRRRARTGMWSWRTCSAPCSICRSPSARP
jgi:DNA-directed RNA polymerase specialized sigma24 family protein